MHYSGRQQVEQQQRRKNKPISRSSGVFVNETVQLQKVRFDGGVKVSIVVRSAGLSVCRSTLSFFHGGAYLLLLCCARLLDLHFYYTLAAVIVPSSEQQPQQQRPPFIRSVTLLISIHEYLLNVGPSKLNIRTHLPYLGAGVGASPPSITQPE